MSNQGGSYCHGQKFRNNSSRKSQASFHVPLEPLKDGRRMDPQERIFLEAAEHGDKPTIIRCLQGPTPVNVNATNMMGRSAIQIAVDNENVEIVELLLKQEGVQIGDALLYAIREGVYRIVEMLIDHPSITREMLGAEWCKFKQPGEESADYSPDISPVILAAHCNQFEILQLLLSRGARIERPHAMSCTCHKCRINIQSDSLRHSLLRIHTYRALASSAWISLTSPDPILTAFKLSWELEHLASHENEFKDIYMELSESCKAYACSLLDQCRSSEEVIAVLNKESDSDDDTDDIDVDNLQLSRLKLALKYEQKQFVSHPHCQQLLASLWYEGIPGWRKYSFITKICIIVGLIAAMPFMAVYYLIFPRSRLGELIKMPFMKFMYHSATFGMFLVILIMASTNVSAAEADQLERQEQRGPPPSPLETLVVLYVFGFIWAECKQIWDEGLKAYVRQWWNWLDFIMLSLYLCTFSLRMIAWWLSHYEQLYGPSHMPRSQWPDADPTLVSEGVFAIANVFSFARIIYLFQANPQLGPLQISLGCMLIDIGKFLFIFFLVLISFACGLNQLYYYYSNSVNRVDGSLYNTSVSPPLQTEEEFENAFDPISDSMSNLFWALFGLTPLSTVRDGAHIKPFTKLVGEFLLMAYHGMAIIVLVNMLIAMMSSSFNKIEDHADREWKFARSKLWMGYFDEGSTLPPPFNLIVSPKSIYYLSQKCRQWVGDFMSYKEQQTRNSHPRRMSTDGTIKLLGVENNNAPKESSEPSISAIAYVNNHVEGNICFGDDGLDLSTTSFSHPNNSESFQNVEPQVPTKGSIEERTSEKPKYQDVMRRLVSRYIHHWKKQMRQDGVNEDDLLEIKQDISSLRYELREDRKRESARTTGHIDNLKKDIIRSIKSQSVGGVSTQVFSCGGSRRGHSQGSLYPAGAGGDSGLRSPSTNRSPSLARHESSGNGVLASTTTCASLLLDPTDLEDLKQEIVRSLRLELREIARDLVMTAEQSRQAPCNTIPINSELYQTHLYTQL